ncbi:MAG: rhamnogalacturonan lyase [Sedimentisphaerales bacterium]|nr:rhamnogalacturonan lyase [Sedimentisphaerales bacterium]
MAMKPLAILATVFVLAGTVQAQRQMEKLDRGAVAIAQGDGKVYVGWRLLGTDPNDVAFNVYRGDTKVNDAPIANSTNVVDEQGDPNALYAIRAVVDDVETQACPERSRRDVASLQQAVKVWSRSYFSVPLQKPAGGSCPDGQRYTYSADDCSVGDLDGDGDYEIVLKWEPSNSKRPPQTGFTGPHLLDAYELDGTHLWRIDLGRNIRAGAAFTQFLVYDFDGDGKAELVCKTADGTVDGQGNVIGDADADWRLLASSSDPKYGKILDGPEYLTVFDGQTGAALATTDYIPPRGDIGGWGGIGGNGGNDNTGNRVDHFSACVVYLDGVWPSAVMIRGWYGRTVLAAWDWRDGKLTQRWVFDTHDGGTGKDGKPDLDYAGMANHQVTVADFDADGRDEICVGAMVVDDDGHGLFTTGLRHGDALHVSNLDPTRPGLEVFGIHENEGRTVAFGTPGAAMYDGRTGEIIFGVGPGADVGRGVAADIDPRHLGCENWGGPGGLRDCQGRTICKATPSSTNFVIWWDADLTRELLDRNHIDKWNWMEQTTDRLLTATECSSNGGTKAVPCLSADLLGDWREEVIWRTSNSTALHIYTTTIPTTYRFHTLMHDPQYRLAIAWQNVAYNQPPHVSFYLGAGMKAAPRPNIRR